MKCIPCRKGETPLDHASSASFQLQLPGWELVEIDGIERLRRTFKFKDFAQALAFTVKVGALAEQEDHHPTLLTEWGRVTVTWWTHVIKGLHRNDFIMAARTDELYTQN
jgi:4a-hydroxytetrahydrobiopterin dehydratase